MYHLSALWNLLSGKIKGNALMFQTDYAAFILPISLWYKLTGSHTKVIMDTRSMPMDTATTKGKLRYISFKLSHWLASVLADGQTAITEEMVKTVRIPRNQLLGVWPSGVNPDEFSSCLANRKWPKAEDPVKLIYLGTLRPERNLITMLEAVALARREGVNVRLEVIGEGSQRAELEDYARSVGNGIIKVSPPVASKDVPLVLSRAHIGLLPFQDVPKMRVSSAIKLFEYMAAGMPLIATRIVAHTEVLRDGKFVFWDDDATPRSMASAIIEACSSKMDFPVLGAQARDLAKNWSWEASAKKLSNALDKTLNNEL
jgi:glycosyltransferase involved in cell wall biosynthesis